MKPLVSVIMPVYNSEQYICESLESILNQTFQNFEVIIIDDGSTDSTYSLIQNYQKQHRAIQVKRLKHNRGLTIGLNLGIKLAQGKYIARMDADDISLPFRFEKQVAFLETHPNVVALGTAFRLIDNDGNTIKDYLFSSNHSILLWNLLFFNPICHPSVMMRASALNQIGAYDINLKRAQDYDLWWRIATIGELSNLPDQHLIMRQHPKRVTNQHQNEQKNYVAQIGSKHLNSIFNREFSQDTLEYIREKCKNADTAVIAAHTMIDYALHCLKNASFSAKKIIIWQSYQKIIKKTWRFALYPSIWHVWLRLPFLLSSLTK